MLFQGVSLLFHWCFMVFQGVSLRFQCCFMVFQGVSLLFHCCLTAVSCCFTAVSCCCIAASLLFLCCAIAVSRCFKVCHCPVSSCFIAMKQVQWERDFSLHHWERPRTLALIDRQCHCRLALHTSCLTFTSYRPIALPILYYATRVST